MNVILYTLLTLGIMGIVSGGLLAFAAKKLSVPTDPRIDEVLKVLPGSNCGACGHASCRELAKALVEKKVPANSCIAGGLKVAEELAEILGEPVSDIETVTKIAVVQCRGGKDVAKERFEYNGIEDCQAALLVSGGHKACVYGCLGLGNCVRICPFDAIFMDSGGIPVVDPAKCMACGKCVKACPRGIIALISRDQKVYLGCVSKDKLKKVRDVCKVGCITCGICVKPGITKEGLVTMGENLPTIHWEKGKDLVQLMEQAINKCPNKCFVVSL